MSITRYPPNTVLLSNGADDPVPIINDLVASEAVTPGMLVERFQASAGVAKFRKHSTAAGATAKLVALNQSMLNRGVDTAYAIGDLMEVAVMRPGSTAWMLIGSGVSVVAGAKLESAGNGLLRALTGANPLFTALVDTDNTAGPSSMRIKVEAL